MAHEVRTQEMTNTHLQASDILTEACITMATAYSKRTCFWYSLW